MKNISTMTLQEEFSNIIKTENQEALLPFLKKLDKKDKKTLSPFLKKEYKHYYDFVDLGDGKGWGRKGSEKQHKIIAMAGYFCFDYKTFRSKLGFFDVKQIDSTIDFYQPSWLNEYINSFASAEWIPGDLTYEWIMRNYKKGVLHPSNEILVKTIGGMPYEHKVIKKQTIWNYNPEKLEQFEETLKEHFWLIFKYETNIYYQTRWLRFKGNEEEEFSWVRIIGDLCAKNKLPRKKVLQETLVATTLNFNRNLINWYIDLFLELKPNVEELLEMQPELFQTFNSTQSKPKNEVLKICKKLVLKSNFDNQAFLENAPILLASETKSVVVSTLMVLEKMAKKEKKLSLEIAKVACNAFLQNEDNVQTRAAKIIAKYGSSENEELKAEINMYQSGLVSNAKELLGDYLEITEEIEQEEILSSEPRIVICEENKIPFPQTFDDVVFLASQVFEGNESWQFDILPAALIKFHNEMDADKLDQLTPAIQKVHKIIYEHRSSSNTGFAENLLAYFMFEYANLLLEKFPKAEKLKSLQTKRQKNEATKVKESDWYKSVEVSLAKWEVHENSETYLPFRKIMESVLEKLKRKNKNPLPLLSTITHAPYWIDSKVYIERLSQYQTEDETPDDADWQVAISRIAFENLEEAIELAKKKLKGDWLEMTLFLFEKDFITKKRPTYTNEWKIAAFTKGAVYGFDLLKKVLGKDVAQRNLDKNFDFELARTERWYDDYDYYKKTKTRKMYVDKKLKVIYHNENIFTNILRYKEDKTVYSGKDETEKQFYLKDCLTVSNYNRDFYVMPSDMIKLFSLTPNNLEQVIAPLIGVCNNYSEFGDGHSKELGIVTSNILLENGHKGSRGVHLFVACVMTCSDKTLRALGAELWINGITENTIDIFKLGNMLGEMERVEFFPLKRLTDLIMENMMKISSNHNRSLEVMIQELVKRLPDEPIKNTKKILEIYKEILALNKNELTDKEVKAKLKIWKDISSLKKIVKQLF